MLKHSEFMLLSIVTAVVVFQSHFSSAFLPGLPLAEDGGPIVQTELQCTTTYYCKNTSVWKQEECCAPPQYTNCTVTSDVSVRDCPNGCSGGNCAPVAVASASPNPANLGEPIAFSSAGSYDPEALPGASFIPNRKAEKKNTAQGRTLLAQFSAKQDSTDVAYFRYIINHGITGEEGGGGIGNGELDTTTQDDDGWDGFDIDVDLCISDSDCPGGWCCVGTPFGDCQPCPQDECTVDADCPNEGECCLSGTCQSCPPACITDADCPPGFCCSIISGQCGGCPLNYYWDFNDGSSSTLPNPTHTYASPGTYVVRLTVTDAEGLTDSATVTVTVESTQAPVNTPPIAAIRLIHPSNGRGKAPLSVDVASESVDPDGEIVYYRWEFGDGAVEEGADKTSATHLYTQPGTYTITLTVRDNTNTESSDTVQIEVTEKPSITSLLVSTSTTVDSNITVDARCNVNETLVISFRDDSGQQVDQHGQPATVTYNMVCNSLAEFGPFVEVGSYSVTASFPTGIDCEECSKTATFLVIPRTSAQAPESPIIAVIVIVLALYLLTGTKRIFSHQ